jgi:chaperonin GroEL
MASWKRGAASLCVASGADLFRFRADRRQRKTGVDIVRKALPRPTRQIALNAGDDGSVVVGKILDKEQHNYGYAQTREYGNLMTRGITDPAKVMRCALQDAASIAGLLLTTEAVVAEVADKASAAPAMPPGGMDY